MDIYIGENFKVIFLDRSQKFPGVCIIVGLNDRESLSELNDKEWIEVGKLEKELERVTKKLFNATYFNFACLMNNAYRDNETPNVHFWFFPRYQDEVKLFDKVFVDKHFGKNFWNWTNDEQEKQRDIFTEEEKQKMFDMIKEEFNPDNVK